jgi:DNA-binding GntR family transcriptional regulator
MTTMDMYKKLTDSEFKTYHLIETWRDGKKKMIVPNEQYLCEHLGKGRTAIYKALAGLREKGLIA